MRVFKYYVFGTGIYSNEKISEAEIKNNYNARFVEKQNLVHPIVDPHNSLVYLGCAVGLKRLCKIRLRGNEEIFFI